MKKALILFVSTFFTICNLIAAEGFNEFKFGDDPDTVMASGRNKCNFGRLEKDTRWIWKSYLGCRNYDFKEGIKATIHFDFSGDELRRIYIVSIDINNYFLIRHPKYDYLIPKQQIADKTSLTNLADTSITKDKIHEIDKEYKYINFFHQGSWQWEFIYEDFKYIERDRVKEERQLEDEADKGLTNWNDFAFDEEDDVIRKKLEGFCSSIKTTAALNQRKIIHCSGFPFMKSKITALFGFSGNKLVSIELQFEPKWYETLLPMLKRKYGRPYTELEQNPYYYPYIDFPEKNILLIHKINPSSKGEKIKVSLVYYKEGFLDKNAFQSKTKREKEPKERAKDRSNQLLDVI